MLNVGSRSGAINITQIVIPRLSRVISSARSRHAALDRGKIFAITCSLVHRGAVLFRASLLSIMLSK
jgi:hypothetical protein